MLYFASRSWFDGVVHGGGAAPARHSIGWARGVLGFKESGAGGHLNLLGHISYCLRSEFQHSFGPRMFAVQASDKPQVLIAPLLPTYCSKYFSCRSSACQGDIDRPDVFLRSYCIYVCVYVFVSWSTSLLPSVLISLICVCSLFLSLCILSSCLLFLLACYGFLSSPFFLHFWPSLLIPSLLYRGPCVSVSLCLGLVFFIGFQYGQRISEF